MASSPHHFEVNINFHANPIIMGWNVYVSLLYLMQERTLELALKNNFDDLTVTIADYNQLPNVSTVQNVSDEHRYPQMVWV